MAICIKIEGDYSESVAKPSLRGIEMLLLRRTACLTALNLTSGAELARPKQSDSQAFR